MADNILPTGTDWNNWQQQPGNSFVYMYQAGRRGRNYGRGNGLTHINKYLYGTHRARYYLVGADSGVGKTTISDFMFILKAYEEAKRTNKRFKCFYCSFEISKPIKVARWISYYVFVKHGERLPPDYILGRIEGHRVSDIHDTMVREAFEVVEDMFKYIDFLDVTQTPGYIFDSIVHGYFAYHGKVEWTKVSDEDAKRGITPNVKGFTPNNPELFNDTMVMLYIDHAALADEEPGLFGNLKKNLDLLSKKCVILRDKFMMTIIFIQQFSTDLLEAGRQLAVRKTFTAISPTRQDLGDSKATFRDADTVIGFIAPGKDLPDWEGYDLSPSAFGTYLVIGFIMKNRGPANKIVPLLLDPITGYVYDAPYPYNPIAGEPLEEKVQQIHETWRLYSPRPSSHRPE
jgi:hypothetical protein